MKFLNDFRNLKCYQKNLFNTKKNQQLLFVDFIGRGGYIFHDKNKNDNMRNRKNDFQ